MIKFLEKSNYSKLPLYFIAKLSLATKSSFILQDFMDKFESPPLLDKKFEMLWMLFGQWFLLKSLKSRHNLFKDFAFTMFLTSETRPYWVISQFWRMRFSIFWNFLVGCPSTQISFFERKPWEIISIPKSLRGFFDKSSFNKFVL